MTFEFPSDKIFKEIVPADDGELQGHAIASDSFKRCWPTPSKTSWQNSSQNVSFHR